MKPPRPVYLDFLFFVIRAVVVLAAAVFIAGLMLFNVRLNDFTLSLPRAEDVVWIDMQWRSRVGSIAVDTPDEINTVISALTGARRVGIFNSASNEVPVVSGVTYWLAVYIYVSAPFDHPRSGARSRRLYLYTQGRNTYIWHGYVGIFRVRASNSAEIFQLFERNSALS